MARVNQRELAKLLQRFQREAKNKRRESTPMGNAILLKMEEWLQSAPKDQRYEAMKFLHKRMQREGDDFLFSHSLQPWTEAIAGIFLGVYKTEEDIMNINFFSNMGKKSGLFFKERGTKGDFYNVKVISGRGSIRISSNVDIKLDSTGYIDQSLESIASDIIIMYATNVGQEFRVMFPVFKEDPNRGFFDLGLFSLLSMVELMPNCFKVELDKRSPLIGKETEQIINEFMTSRGQGGNGGYAELKEIADSSFKMEEKQMREILASAIDKARVSFWRRYGRLRIELNQPTVLARHVNPLINTGIQRYEDHAPFYSLLKRLFGAKRGKEYFDGNLNKGHDYYAHKYPSPRY